MAERTTALKNLKLLVGTGCCQLPKGIAGMDSLNKHVEQISFRQCVTFWQSGFQPTVAKNSISTILHCFVAFVTWKHGADFCKMPQTKKYHRNFTVTGKISVDRARTANFGYRKIYSERSFRSFESITDFQFS